MDFVSIIMYCVFLAIPYMIVVGFINSLLRKIKKQQQNLDESQKVILTTANEKIKNTKMWLVYILIILTAVLFLFVNILEVENTGSVIAMTLESESVQSTELELVTSVNSYFRIFIKILKFALDFMLANVITYYSFLIFVEKTKKLTNEERDVVKQVYSGKTISSVLLTLFIAIYKVAINFIMSPT